MGGGMLDDRDVGIHGPADPVREGFSRQSIFEGRARGWSLCGMLGTWLEPPETAVGGASFAS